MRPRRIQGFTLIELMITVSIMLVLFGLTLASYTSYSDKQRIRQTSVTLKADLHLARTNAMSGKKPITCTGLQEVFEGYKVTFYVTSYSIVPQCRTGNDVIDKTEEKVDVFFPSGVTLTMTGHSLPFSYTYYPLTKGTSLTANWGFVFHGVTTISFTIDKESGEVNLP